MCFCLFLFLGDNLIRIFFGYCSQFQGDIVLLHVVGKGFCLLVVILPFEKSAIEEGLEFGQLNYINMDVAELNYSLN